jgi:hypothetical protein
MTEADINLFNCFENFKKSNYSPTVALAELQYNIALSCDRTSSEYLLVLKDTFEMLLEIERPIIDLNKIPNKQFFLNFKSKELPSIISIFEQNCFDIDSSILPTLKKDKILMSDFGIISPFSHSKSYFKEIFFVDGIFTDKRPYKKR